MRVPVLLISLAEGTLGPKSNVDFLATRVPSQRWHIERGAGVEHLDHFEWIKDSAVLGPAVAEWVTRGELPG
ncbi:hypothetical protein ACWEKJ_39230 [Amycolatopsis thermoflava]